MMKSYKILFINSMIIGTMITISSYSWLIAWMGLEINLLSIIPLLKNISNKFPSEAALKYFIIQVMASSIMLFAIIYFFSMNNSISKEFLPLESILLNSALFMKIGAAPFHFWLPEVMSGLNWPNFFIILTWQKIAPIILISYNIKTNILFSSIIIILSSMISGLQGLNQTCLRKILTYSSINHVGWMISSLLNSLVICLYYYIIYVIINLNIILILNKNKILFINQLSNVFSHSKKTKYLFMLNFLSLGGLPPLLGFFPKWMTIYNLVDNKHYLLASMLIIFTLISLYFYLRITFSSFTIYSQETLIIMFNKINFFYFFTNFVSLTGLIICSLAYSFL